ncbi:uncharacterized protein LOC101859927, partial [Aplysia californica]|uniref:Uncharacterized protein LOC101859927 n=1 Tax=Aplysia californica TaxID=6500 RepID=A0ABM0JL15_APLCA
MATSRHTWRSRTMWLHIVMVVGLMACVCTVSAQERRCICWLSKGTELYSYDMELMHLVLPCTYRLTSLKTLDGNCHLTVDIKMTSEEGQSTRAAGIRYLVTTNGHVTGGIIDDRGVQSIAPSLHSSQPMLMSRLIRVNGVQMLAYKDESQSYKLGLPACRVTLDLKPGKYLGVYSHSYSTDYMYNYNDLCGDC